MMFWAKALMSASRSGKHVIVRLSAVIIYWRAERIPASFFDAATTLRPLSHCRCIMSRIIARQSQLYAANICRQADFESGCQGIRRSKKHTLNA